MIVHNLKPSSTNATTAFGEVAVANLTPVVQMQFPYNINTDIVTGRYNGGSATIVDYKVKLATGAGASQSAHIFSKVPIKYFPGQGGLIRFAAYFTTGAAGSTQIMGVGDSGDGYFFGYNGADFGVLRRNGGNPEIRTLTITTKSTTAEDITITLDGDADATVSVTDATATDVTTTANDIASHDFSGLGSGWDAHAEGATVIFQSFDSSSRTGAYSLSGATTAVGTFAQTLAGVAQTDTWVLQSDWNEDTMDGNGPSGQTVDFTKGNVFQIQYQWLGYGQIRFFMEDADVGGLVPVHKIDYANANTLTSVNNPTLPLCLAVANTTNDTDIAIYTSSFAGFVEGKGVGSPVTHGTSAEFAAIGTTETPLLTIHNKPVFQSTLNRVRIKLNIVTFSLEGTKPATVRVKRNATLTGASFSDIDASNSVVEVDTSASAISGGDELVTVGLAKIDGNVLNTEIFLNPGDSLTITGEATSGTFDGVASFNWEELY